MKRDSLPLLILLAVAAVLALILGLTQPAGSSVTPDVGVRTYNQPMCGGNMWVPVKLPASEYEVHDSAGTCVKPERHRLDFQITSVRRQLGWQYPNISSGYELGESSCPSARDTCYRYPVQQRDDGMPVAAVRAWLAPGQYNLAFDTWFSPSSRRLSYADRAGDTEVMIWLAHPGINESYAYDWHVIIDGAEWGVMTWETGTASGHPWRYVAYVAPRTALGQLSARLWLNPFWRDAEQHGYLSSREWLTAVDLGFELVSGGQGDNIHGYTLAGVR